MITPSSSARHFVRSFSSSAFAHFPRAPPRTSRPPTSAAHLFAPPTTTADTQTTTHAPPAKHQRETEPPGDGEYVAWRPPNFAKPSKQSHGEPRPPRFDRKPQKEHPGDRPGAQTQDAEPPSESEATPKPRRRFPPAHELVVPLHRDAVSLRWETLPPTPDQLENTDRFFLQYPPSFLWSADKFKTIDYGNVPEVAFLGRSNVGKSSLLNALLNNSTMARTSSKPGHTRLMNAFSINQGKLVLLDMPGYGHASRPEWGVQIMKYLLSRKQFRRAFVLIDALHGPKSSDLMLLDHLGASGVPYQIVLSKVDRLKQQELDAAFDNIKALLTDKSERRGTSALGEVLGTAADPAKKRKSKMGIAELRWAVMVAGGLDGSISLK